MSGDAKFCSEQDKEEIKTFVNCIFKRWFGLQVRVDFILFKFYFNSNILLILIYNNRPQFQMGWEVQLSKPI